jgi:uncharacterized protein (DUF1800 family)
VYQGSFGVPQAERLLWRAGFGGDHGDANKLAKKGLKAAVHSLTRPPDARLSGPKPTDGDGNPIAPYDAYGHDVLYWLDRMVRTNQPFVERMALVWHDWFATADVSSQKLSISQYKTLRNKGLGSFGDLLRAVTIDPAMLVWLSGIDNDKGSPNENYGRELMELFTLGVSDESGYPYSEDDVREQARALTGWTADWDDDVGYVNFHFDSHRHDNGSKTIFGQTGNFDWEDSCRLVIQHEAHAGYFVERLWKHFVPTDPDAATRDALVSKYVGSGHEIRPVVEAILMHPDVYTGPALVKAPVVYIAGLLRRRGRGIDTDSWTWISDLAGMRLFRPPNVAGWDESRWLDTSTFRGRWYAASQLTRDEQVDVDNTYPADETPAEAIDAARAYWGKPTLSQTTIDALTAFCEAVETAATENWEKHQFRALRQNALRMLIATAPDLQAC